MKILVTGGVGYIGSHIVVELIEAGHEVEIVDNLSNSSIEVLDGIEKITGVKPKFFNVDLLDESALKKIFCESNYEAVMHLAGLKAVKESVEKPLEYYKNNIGGSISLLEAIRSSNTRKLIFASSATVYGEPGVCEYVETMETGHKITNPYGKTKYVIEELLKDFSKNNPAFEITVLRFFNPIGNHKSGLIGESPLGVPNNIMPYMVKVAKGELKELTIFGNDYDTRDGTCIRDYIYVGDIAKGHLKALEHSKPGIEFYNLGLGHGVSVLELVASFERALGKKLPYKLGNRREGDLAEFYAQNSRAVQCLGWKPETTIDEAMETVVTFMKGGK